VQFAAPVAAYGHQRRRVFERSQVQLEGLSQEHIHQSGALMNQRVHRHTLFELATQFGIAFLQGAP
jgi:hypothetical protein